MELGQFHYYTVTFTYSLYLFLTERKREKKDKSTTGIWIYIYLTISVTFALLDLLSKEVQFWNVLLLMWSLCGPLRHSGSEEEKRDYQNELRETRRLLYRSRLICIIHYINDPIKMLKLMTISVHSHVGVWRRLCFIKLIFLLIDTVWKRRIGK